jgi:hypothetical protein
LLVTWLGLRRFADRNPAERFISRFVAATLLIAAGGLVVGFWPRSPGLMKFYPFRLFDLFLPVAVSMTAAGLIERSRGRADGRRSLLARGAGWGAVALALAWSIVAPGRISNPCHWPENTWIDFQEACDWIKSGTPRDAVFLTPLYNVGFKWFAERAEYVTWKDCPQDAAGILEWNGRRKQVTGWVRRRSKAGISPAALAEIRGRTRVGYLLSIGPPPAGIEPLYSNRTFTVSAIRPARE